MPTSVEICHLAFNALTTRDMPAFFALFAEDAIIELPFAPPGWPKKLIGKEGLAEHLGNYPDHLEIREIAGLRIHETVDPEVVIVEYTILGVVSATQEPYESPYIQVMTAKEGKVVGYRDYWNPLLATALVPGGLN